MKERERENVREKRRRTRTLYDDSWAHQSVIELKQQSIVTLSRGNFRHACISVYNLRASLSVGGAHPVAVDQSEGYVTRSRSGASPFQSLQKNIAYFHRGPTNITPWLITSSRLLAIFPPVLPPSLTYASFCRQIVASLSCDRT